MPLLLGIPDHTKLLLNAEFGHIYINPSDEIVSRFRERNDAGLNLMDQKHLMSPNTITMDGTRIRLMANIDLLEPWTFVVTKSFPITKMQKNRILFWECDLFGFHFKIRIFSSSRFVLYSVQGIGQR